MTLPTDGTFVTVHLSNGLGSLDYGDDDEHVRGPFGAVKR